MVNLHRNAEEKNQCHDDDDCLLFVCTIFIFVCSLRNIGKLNCFEDFLPGSVHILSLQRVHLYTSRGLLPSFPSSLALPPQSGPAVRDKVGIRRVYRLFGRRLLETIRRSAVRKLSYTKIAQVQSRHQSKLKGTTRIKDKIKY